MVSEDLAMFLKFPISKMCSKATKKMLDWYYMAGHFFRVCSENLLNSFIMTSTNYTSVGVEQVIIIIISSACSIFFSWRLTSTPAVVSSLAIHFVFWEMISAVSEEGCFFLAYCSTFFSCYINRKIYSFSSAFPFYS